MLPAYPVISILGGLLFLLLDQGTIGAVPDADATIVASVREGYVIFIIASDKPADSDLRLRRIEGLFEPEGAAELADETTRAACGMGRDRGPLPRSYQREPPLVNAPIPFFVASTRSS